MARNSIILNGKSSDTITGLIIQELPPISKPLMRSQVEEIDGRDGDIITKLGFSAYDKEISVGLYGNFDINEVIAFFNSEGTVTFSNEPDKFYYYQILDQIDFERLVRFRTATINFHVQPFKYSTTEEAETIEADTVSGEGNNLVLENTSDAPFSKLTPKGDTFQQTYSGKNLFYINYGVNTNQYPLASTGIIIITTELNSLTIEATGTTGAQYLQVNMSNLDNTKTYTLSGIGKKLAVGDSGIYVRWRGSNDGTTWSGYTTIVNKTTPTVGEEYSFSNAFSGYNRYQILFYNSSKSSVEIGEKTTYYDIQLEEGAEATAFEPFVGGIPSPNPDYPQGIQVVTGDQTVTITNSDNTDSQTYSLTLGNLELAKIGTYQDYIYKNNGDWYIHKEINKAVLTGDTGENWAKANISGRDVYYSDKITDYLRSGNTPISNNGTGSTNVSGASSVPANCICFGSSDAQSRFYFRYDGVWATTTALTTWLSTNNMTVYYALATPTDTAITDETLIAQLEALNAAHAYKGRTHIISTAGSNANLPHIIEAKVLGSSDTTITNAGNFISKPKFTIYGSGNIGLYINGIQILQIALGDEQYITIDAAQMEAYKDTLDNLKNRLVTGDYTNLALNPGENQISFSGSVEKYIVENYSRWL